MAGNVYLIQSDKSLQAMTEQPYQSEDALQELLESYPELLAGDQMDTSVPRRLFLISREVGVPGELEGYDRSSLDHLFIDQDGIPTLVEVKRSTDTRIRREVVRQMLDYAANAVAYWPVEKLRASFEITCNNQSKDPQGAMLSFLGLAVDEAGAADAFWMKVKTNLQAGHIRLIFLADKIPMELQRIIEFLNEQMDPAEVLGVELRQFVGKEFRTMVPRVLGLTAASNARKGTHSEPRTQWDEKSFFEELEKVGTEPVVISRQLLHWIRPRVSRIWWAKAKRWVRLFRYSTSLMSGR